MRARLTFEGWYVRLVAIRFSGDALTRFGARFAAHGPWQPGIRRDWVNHCQTGPAVVLKAPVLSLLALQPEIVAAKAFYCG